MAKFKIAQNPTFKANVSIPRVGGDPIDVEFTFRVKTRKELAMLFDEWAAASKELLAGFDIEDATHLAWVEGETELQVRQIKDIVLGWGFDDEFNDENIYALCETSVGAPQAVVDAYRETFAKTRLGN